ncbi:MAG: hypothetical protein ACOVNY_00075 [Chitinophagaceae bacterium]
MIPKLKSSLLLITTTALIVTASVTAPYTKMFGKNYKKGQDFFCCKNNRLVVHHYYAVNFLWIEVATGYTEEVVGKIKPEECNVKCD